MLTIIVFYMLQLYATLLKRDNFLIRTLFECIAQMGLNNQSPSCTVANVQKMHGNILVLILYM